MKILIGTACACVIGMTAFFFVYQYVEFKHEQRAEFWDYCQQIGSQEMKDKMAEWKSEGNLSAMRLELKKVEKCQDVALHGF